MHQYLFPIVGSKLEHRFITNKVKIILYLVKLAHFLDNQVRKLFFKVLQRNGYFAYTKNVLLGMQVDDTEDI